jgi:hypothetical protein
LSQIVERTLDGNANMRGDMYAPKHAAASVEARDQNVRILAAYDVAQLPR